MPLSRLLYFSKRNAQTPAMLDDEIDDVLNTSREWNKNNGLSGVLLADHEYFLQLLEGRRPALNEALVRIMASKKHSEVTLCDFRSVDYRVFNEFQMLYQPMEGVLSKMVKSMADPTKGADIVGPDIIVSLLSLYNEADFLTVELTENQSLVA